MAALVLTSGAFLLGAGAPASAQGGFLDPVDSQELASAMLEATGEQGVCYGWRVNAGGAGYPTVTDVGSSLGDGIPVDQSAGCMQYVELVADISYTSELSESEDSASYQINSNLANPPTTRDLASAGLSESALLGESDDLAIINAVSSLPLIVAEKGEAPYLELEPNTTEEIPSSDGATDSPGSDFLRENLLLLVLGGVALIGGSLWALSALLTSDRY